jgi:hypothetical protein
VRFEQIRWVSVAREGSLGVCARGNISQKLFRSRLGKEFIVKLPWWKKWKISPVLFGTLITSAKVCNLLLSRSTKWIKSFPLRKKKVQKNCFLAYVKRAKKFFGLLFPSRVINWNLYARKTVRVEFRIGWREIKFNCDESDDVNLHFYGNDFFSAAAAPARLGTEENRANEKT